MIELVGAVVLGIVVSLIASDVSRNIDSICYWLTQRAASLAPKHLRVRLAEEWSADIDDASSVVLKCFIVAGFFVAISKIKFGVFNFYCTSIFDERNAIDYKSDKAGDLHCRDADERHPESFGSIKNSSPAILAVHGRLADHFGRQGPWYQLDPLSQLVLGIIGARTRSSVSLSALETLIQRFESWDAVRDASYSEVREAIARVTFSDNKARHLQAALRQVTETRGRLDLEFLAFWPVDSALAWLENLPGVGRRVSAATLNFSSLRKRALVIDTHHLRVMKRLGMLRVQAGFEEAYHQFTTRLPSEWTASDADDHHQLVKQLGRTVCRYDTPACIDCPLRDLCPTGSYSTR